MQRKFWWSAHGEFPKPGFGKILRYFICWDLKKIHFVSLQFDETSREKTLVRLEQCWLQIDELLENLNREEETHRQTMCNYQALLNTKEEYEELVSAAVFKFLVSNISS